MNINWPNTTNRIRHHDSNETDEHFYMKVGICLAIFRQGGTYFTESKLKRGVCDIFWLDEKMVVEIETNYTEKKAAWKMKQYDPFNVIIIDIKKMTLDDALIKLGLDK